jgi:Pyridoxal-phosphate dependent enzyme
MAPARLENRPCGGRYGDIVESIGHTPLIELKRLSPKPGVRIWAKLESRNPTGSVKDRVARALIEDAEQEGVIRQRAKSTSLGAGPEPDSNPQDSSFTHLRHSRRCPTPRSRQPLSTESGREPDESQPHRAKRRPPLNLDSSQSTVVDEKPSRPA